MFIWFLYSFGSLLIGCFIIYFICITHVVTCLLQYVITHKTLGALTYIIQYERNYHHLYLFKKYLLSILNKSFYTIIYVNKSTC